MLPDACTTIAKWNLPYATDYSRAMSAAFSRGRIAVVLAFRGDIAVPSAGNAVTFAKPNVRLFVTVHSSMKGLILAATVLAGAITGHNSWQRQVIGAEQDHSLAQGGDCDHFYSTTFTSFPAQVDDQEQRELPLNGVDLLHVVTGQEGSVSIRGWNKPYARLIVCRHAVGQTREEARRILGSITVSHAEGDIVARGPELDETQAWWANIILYVPRKTNIEVHAANGGVAIRNVEGRVTASATRGGISVAQSSGRYDISTDSGGITLERISGRVSAASHGGTIALRLTPPDVPSLEVKTERPGDIVCRLDACRGGSSTWTANRRLLRIGGGAPDYRLSTTGAPIVIDYLR
jgi:hypothetical protein